MEASNEKRIFAFVNRISFTSLIMDISLPGYTALCTASEKGHSSVVEILLSRGADVNAKTNSGKCFFSYTIQLMTLIAVLMINSNDDI